MKRILNVGCGKDWYGTDRIDILKSDSTTKVADIEKGLPYDDEIFDEVYSEHVFEHMKNPHNLILEMKRVCKPKGKIIVITDNAGFLMFHIFRKNKNNYHGNHNLKEQYGKGGFINDDRHYALYTIEHLRNHFERAGLKVVYKDMIEPHRKLSKFMGARFSCASVRIMGVKND